MNGIRSSSYYLAHLVLKRKRRCILTALLLPPRPSDRSTAVREGHGFWEQGMRYTRHVLNTRYAAEYTTTIQPTPERSPYRRSTQNEYF